MKALTFIRRQPHFFTVLAVALIAVLVSLIWTRSTGRATSGGDPYSVPLVTDTNPDPDIVETTIIAQAATVEIGPGPGVMANVLTFNGSIPGPEFRLKVGDTVIVHFENQIAHATGIHWHGIELDNASDGTPLSQNQVPPGGKFLYKFKVTRPGIFWYHPHHHSSTNQVFQGLYGPIVVTDPNESALVSAGTIPGLAQTLTLALSDVTVCKAPGANGSDTKSLCEGAPDGRALDEDGNPRGSYNAGDVPNIQLPGGSLTVKEGVTVLTNGKNVGGRGGTPSAPGALAANATTLDVQAGQGLRLQLGNTAATRFFRLRLTDDSGTQIPLVRIGGQGGLLDNAVIEGGVVSGFDFLYDSGEILLDPGDRADVVAAIPASATGVLTLWTEDFPRHGNFMLSNIPTVPVMHLHVNGVASSTYTISAGTALRAATGDPVPALGAPSAALLNPASFSAAKPGMSSQDIRLTNSSSTLGINSVRGSHDFPGDYTLVPHEGSTRYAKLGDTLELTVTNATGAHHPFHLHGFSIQPISLTDTMADPPPDGMNDAYPGTAPPYTFLYHEFRDNIDVPGGYTLKFRVKLDDRPLIDGTTLGGGLGRWVFHCHIFFHATFGMISEFDVVAADGNERPYINADETSLEGSGSTVFTMHGTYHDPDGDTPISLSASTGTITDDGDGLHWTWTRTGGSSGLVYVTATDPGGRKDQAAFAIKANAPPVVTASSASGNEGAMISISGTATDPDSDPLTTTWSYVAGAGVDAGATCTFANASALSTTISCTDDGTYMITLTANDGVSLPVSANAALTVSNVAPSVTITSPPSGTLAIVGTTVTVTASIADPGTNDTFSCAFDWDGGGVNSSVPAVGTSCSKTNTFAAAGVYTVAVTATDDDSGVSVPAGVLIVIFDPNAGFVTGGGTIDSPAGAYPASPLLTGKANFGFNLKYQKGTLVPSGSTQFDFHDAGFNFHTTAFEWLVVAGSKAQYKGSGTVNGVGNYGFLLTAIDGEVLGGGGIDKFRLKIWDKSAGNTVVYDNVPGAPEDIDVANPLAIASGSIVIH